MDRCGNMTERWGFDPTHHITGEKNDRKRNNIFVVIGMIVAMMMIFSSTYASQESSVTYVHDYDSYISQIQKSSLIINIFGFKFPIAKSSVAVPSTITNLVKVQYVPETISGNMYNLTSAQKC